MRGGRGKGKNKNKSGDKGKKTKGGEDKNTAELTGEVTKKGGKKYVTVALPRSSSSSSSTDSSTSSSSSSGEEDAEAERQAQKRYLYLEHWGELYQPRRTYAPDAAWSADDCRVLAVVEARYEALRYHHVQAEFFNATGRMVDVELIRHKLEGGGAGPARK